MSIEKEINENKSIDLSGDIHLVEDGWNYDNSKGIGCRNSNKKICDKF